MVKKFAALLLLGYSCVVCSADFLQSKQVLVVDQNTGQVLMDKKADSAAPIASVTKLMTAMVVLDSAQNPDEILQIKKSDLDSRERVKTGIPVGTSLPRSKLIGLALLASDNRAAAALANNFSGGREAFDSAMQQKITQLNLRSTTIEEPTGLSPRNQASPQDLVLILKAAMAYPEITQATSQSSDAMQVNGRLRTFNNTNGLVGRPGWDILLSKTGTTLAAGRCLVMQMQSAGRSVFVVLMGAVAKSARAKDARIVQKMLADDTRPA
jgi:serine-type D-Ala-D-Ala endopeptidase (penicillin-binding protein 7)